MLLIISSYCMGSCSTLSTIRGSILTVITKFITRAADWIFISLSIIFHFFPESKWTSSHTVVLCVRSFPRGISIKFEVHKIELSSILGFLAFCALISCLVTMEADLITSLANWSKTSSRIRILPECISTFNNTNSFIWLRTSFTIITSFEIFVRSIWRVWIWSHTIVVDGHSRMTFRAVASRSLTEKAITFTWRANKLRVTSMPILFWTISIPYTSRI